MIARLWLIRHGETEWSRSGAHTGRTDLPLTEHGRERAQALGKLLRGRPFAQVLSSPLARARETCRLAGYGDVMRIEPNLREWDYGDYEGLSTAQIREQRPDWSLWVDGVLNGETVEQVGERARAVIQCATSGAGDAALFAHGHILRILAACWLGLAPANGRLLGLDTASISILGYERDTRVIRLWNAVAEGLPEIR
ncbi:MAG TPA: histidine phosphatase family protein [Bryobacteraceae bacterium]|nr:histidine phosphatase family protein [Bryobacteraceae bacterium]